ncbi:hypothetical protein D3C75_1116210 [compost metagenome]
MIERALSEARNSAVAAISSVVTIRPVGILLRNCSFAIGSFPTNRSNIAVATGPGAMALTRTPSAATSSAAERVNPLTACLLAE